MLKYQAKVTSNFLRQKLPPSGKRLRSLANACLTLEPLRIFSPSFGPPEPRFICIRDSLQNINRFLVFLKIVSTVTLDQTGVLRDTFKAECDDRADVQRLPRSLSRSHIRHTAAWTLRERVRAITQAPIFRKEPLNTDFTQRQEVPLQASNPLYYAAQQLQTFHLQPIQLDLGDEKT